MVWRKGREKEKKNNNTREVEGFETTLSCYVESYLNKFVPCSELTRNSQTCEKQNREKHTPKKNNHTHEIVFTWFKNLLTSTELQGFHYYQGRNTKYDSIVFFFFSVKTTSRKLYSPKQQFLYLARRIHNGLQNGPKNFSRLSAQAFAPWTKPQKISY